MNGVREHYKEHGDIDVAIRNFPRRLIAERAIVSVFCLPFLGILDYIVTCEHFYCPTTAIGYVCNDLASFGAYKVYYSYQARLMCPTQY